MKKLFLSFLVVFCLLATVVWSEDITPVEDLGEIVISASRIAQKDYKVAGNVIVINQKQIEQSNAQNVPDLLKEALGVNVYDNGTAKTSVIDIHGFGDTASRNVLILVDDRKINTVDISAPDLLQIPLESIERIEVIRGAASVLYGDNAVGGVVNIITKKGKGALKGQVNFFGGSYDKQGTAFQISGEKHHVSYFLNSKYFDDRGYRANSDVLLKDFNARLGYDWTDKITVDLNAGWHEDDYKLPGGLSDTELQTIGRRGTVNPDDFANTKDRFVNLGFDVTPWPENVYLGKLSLNFNYRNRDVYDAFFAFGEFSTKRNIDTKGFTGKYIFDHEVFSHEVNFVTGVDYYETENDILGSGTNVDNIDISKDELGIYSHAQTEIFNNLFLNGGVRYHQAEYTFNQKNVIVFQSQRPDQWTYSGGMKYEYGTGSNLFWNIEQTFRFLATDEWYSTANFPGFGITPGLNLNLDQQKGIQYEVGIKHNFNNKVIATVTPYWLDQKNEIFFDPVTFANSNYPKTRRIGVEIGQTTDVLKFINIGFLDKLDFVTNFVYQVPQFNGGTNDGNDIPFVQRYQVSSGFSTEFAKHFSVSLNSRYIGSRYPINDTGNVTAKQKPFFVVDEKFAYKEKNWEAYVSLNNAFNELYDTYVAKSTFSATKSHFPAPERNVLVGMNVKF